MVKTTLRQLGTAIQLLVHGIRFVCEHLKPLEHRATTNAGKPVSVLRGIAEKKCRLCFLHVSLFSTCLDCFFVFVLTRNKCVTVFIQCFCPILLCFILSYLDNRVESPPGET